MSQTQVAPLLAHIAHSIVAPRLKKRLFRPPYLPFLTYLVAYQEAFEMGVVLGYAYRDKMSSFARLLCSSGNETEFVEMMQDLASKRIAQRPNAVTFVELGMSYEDERMKHNWRESGVKESESAVYAKAFEVPASSAWGNIGVALHTGIGFGSRFSGRTEQFWRNEHEHSISEERWNYWKEVGLIRRDEAMGQNVTLAESQRELVARVEAFAAEHRPEILPEIQQR